MDGAPRGTMRAPWSLVVGLLLTAACGGPAPSASAIATQHPSSAAPDGPSASQPAATASSVAVADAWEERGSADEALLEVGVAVLDGRIWVAGGLRTDGSASDGVEIYDPAADAWSRGPRLPEAIHHSALVTDGQVLWLVGGYVGNDLAHPTAAVRRLDPGADAWVDDRPLPGPRGAGAAAYDGTRVVYAGGVEPDSVAVEVFVLDADGWRVLGRLSRPREHLAAATDGAGRTFVLGGRVGGLESNLATVDLVEGDAVRFIGDLPTPRGGVAAFWWPTLGACLAGGESPGGTNPQVECIDADGTIMPLPDLGVARHGVGAAVVAETAYVLLGGREPGLFTSLIVEALPLTGR